MNKHIEPEMTALFEALINRAVDAGELMMEIARVFDRCARYHGDHGDAREFSHYAKARLLTEEQAENVKVCFLGSADIGGLLSAGWAWREQQFDRRISARQVPWLALTGKERLGLK